MQLNLNNFDEIIENRFVERGMTYWLDGSVVDLKESKNNWTAKVQGTKLYSVKIELEDDAVVNHECNCPFDAGDVCKHIIAVLFAIKLNPQDSQGKTVNKQIPTNISDILSEVKSFRLSKMRFDSVLYDSVNIAYDAYEYYESLGKKINKFTIEKAQKKLNEITLLEKQITPLINILSSLNYEERKNIYRLIDHLEMLHEELPTIKKMLQKRIKM